MIALTFNSITALLESEFRIDPARVRPDSTLAELGFDAERTRDFILAVEDAFRLHIPRGRIRRGDPSTDLLALCRTLETVSNEIGPQRPPDGRTPLSF